MIERIDVGCKVEIKNVEDGTNNCRMYRSPSSLTPPFQAATPPPHPPARSRGRSQGRFGQPHDEPTIIELHKKHLRASKIKNL